MKTKTKNIKPIHIFLFMLSCMGALAMMCLVMPQESNWAGNIIHAPQLSQVLELEQATIDNQEETDEIESSDSVCIDTLVVLDSIVGTDTTVAVMDSTRMSVVADTLVMHAPPVITDEFIDTFDTRTFLSSFYNSLRDADTEAIRVVHYGDSQIEEDRMTTQIRRVLQNQYGGGGVGIIPLHQTIPSRTVWQSISMNGQTQQINEGPKRYLAYGSRTYRRASSIYGPMGQVAIMDNQLVAGSEDITMLINGSGKSKNTESYFNRIRIVKSGDINVSIERATDRDGDIFYVPDSTTSATIHFEGKGEVYGISLEKDKGVMVDNIPMRGCTGSIFTSVGHSEMQNYFRATNTKLIIMQFGGNIIPYTTSKQQVRQYVSRMQMQIQYLKYLAPNSCVVFVGPGDMLERKDGQLQTHKMLPVVDRALLQMAIEEEVGYFSLYQHMGGKDSMITWKEKGWAGGDYIHFTRKGAEKAGEMLAEWLMKK